MDPTNETHGSCCICTIEYDVEEDNEPDSICVLPCTHIFHKGRVCYWTRTSVPGQLAKEEMDLSFL